jgi:NitT/TauT family transport system permease protein
VPPLVFLAAVVGIWQLAFVAEIKPPYALPSPAQVGEVFWEAVTDGRAANGIWTSLSRGGLGFACRCSSARCSGWPCGGAPGCGGPSARS